jgi:hypothetical protein
MSYGSMLPAGSHLPTVATGSNESSPLHHTHRLPHQPASDNGHWEYFTQAGNLRNAPSLTGPSFVGAASPRHNFRTLHSIPESVYSHQGHRIQSLAPSLSPHGTSATSEDAAGNIGGVSRHGLLPPFQLHAPQLMLPAPRPGEIASAAATESLLQPPLQPPLHAPLTSQGEGSVLTLLI